MKNLSKSARETFDNISLSKKQEELKAYFKGGTAIYKILDK